MIQLLTLNGEENNLIGKGVIINKLHTPQSLDEFDINIIDLNDKNIWRNDDNDLRRINIINDFVSLSKMINTCKKAIIILLLPQNIEYTFNCKYESTDYWRYRELKDMINYMKGSILNCLYNPIDDLSILYENTRTQIFDDEVLASFAFDNILPTKVLTKSIKSDKPTTIKTNNVILSTLNIITYEQLFNFLRQIHLIEEKEEVPDWIKEENMFDDARQLEIIEQNNEIIKTANQNIDRAMESIRKNERYKSILYTSGDELVNVVFEILEQMLGWDLSSFVDVKKEDFNCKNSGKVFIGEIKGITSNVKNANVSQLDNHVQEYLDEHEEEKKDNIIALLIIDHQRNKTLHDREEVHENAINLAIRNKSLIVETITLLKMFEKYLNNTITREKCIEILTTNIGLLTSDKFN